MRSGARRELLIGGVAMLAVFGLALLIGALVRHSVNDYSQAEKLVRLAILNAADDPKAVEFLAWGPHLSGREYRELLRQQNLDLRWRDFGPAEAEAAMFTYIRVRYRGKRFRQMAFGHTPGKDTDVNDQVFEVQPRLLLVREVTDNQFGDDWAAEARRDLGRVFPEHQPQPKQDFPPIAPDRNARAPKS
jgi:hypothetical protein